MIDKEAFVKLDHFLKNTLDGFEYLSFIEKGDPTNVLNNPERYSLNHISANIDAWSDDKNVIIEFNNIGIHFCFTPIEKRIKGLLFVNGVWE